LGQIIVKTKWLAMVMSCVEVLLCKAFGM
jgi:hypothetical protein